MANIGFQITGGEQFSTLGQDFEKIFREELSAALKETLKEGKDIVKATIREANAVASGGLLNSVTALINSLSDYKWQLAGEIKFLPPADEYAAEADKGRGPRRGKGNSDFLERIIAWVSIKGLEPNLAYPIARSINARGTNIAAWSRYNRKSFIDTATARVDAEAKLQYNRALERIQRRLDANANNNSSGT